MADCSGSAAGGSGGGRRGGGGFRGGSGRGGRGGRGNRPWRGGGGRGNRRGGGGGGGGRSWEYISSVDEETSRARKDAYSERDRELANAFSLSRWLAEEPPQSAPPPPEEPFDWDEKPATDLHLDTLAHLQKVLEEKTTISGGANRFPLLDNVSHVHVVPGEKCEQCDQPEKKKTYNPKDKERPDFLRYQASIINSKPGSGATGPGENIVELAAAAAAEDAKEGGEEEAEAALWNTFDEHFF